jgi:hypothetical protein
MTPLEFEAAVKAAIAKKPPGMGGLAVREMVQAALFAAEEVREKIDVNVKIDARSVKNFDVINDPKTPVMKEPALKEDVPLVNGRPARVGMFCSIDPVTGLPYPVIK